MISLCLKSLRKYQVLQQDQNIKHYFGVSLFYSQQTNNVTNHKDLKIFHTLEKSSWWFEPAYLKNMLVKLDSISPVLGVKIQIYIYI